MSEGKKFDGGKPQWHLLPFESLEGAVKVMEFGSVKYGKFNWMNVENGEVRYFDALIRHIVALRSGEELDAESGLPHIDHALCNLIFLKVLSCAPTKT